MFKSLNFPNLTLTGALFVERVDLDLKRHQRLFESVPVIILLGQLILDVISLIIMVFMLLTANFTKVDSFFQAIELCNAILFSGLVAMLAPLGTIFLKFGLRCLHDALISNRLIGYWLLCVISFLNILHLVSLVALSILQL